MCACVSGVCVCVWVCNVCVRVPSPGGYLSGQATQGRRDSRLRLWPLSKVKVPGLEKEYPLFFGPVDPVCRHLPPGGGGYA